MNILITSAGRRVSLVRSFQKEIKKIYPEAKVYASDSNPELSAACQIADGFLKVPLLNEPQYLEELIDFCKSCKIRLIIPTIDTELLLLAQKKQYFKEHGIVVVISSEEFVSKCRDKREIHKFFEENNINVAKEYTKENFKLPIFIKPLDGSRSVDTFIIKSKKDLTEYHYTNEKLMFLEYIDPEYYDEFTCDLYYCKANKLRCVVPRKRLEVRDGEVYKALTVNNSIVSYIKKNLKHIEGAIGCLTTQFFVHKNNEDKIIGIEVNPRFGGGYPLTYHSGANYTKWIIEEYLLDKQLSDKFDSWEQDLLMVRYDDEILVHGYKG